MVFLSWNILTNKVRPGVAKPQGERLASIVKQIEQISPDFLGLYEVDNKVLASWVERLGFKNHLLTNYASDRLDFAIYVGSHHTLEDQHIVEYSQADKRKAIITSVDGVRVAATHLSYRLERVDWRNAQTKSLIHELAEAKHAVIMGDLNCLPWQKARKQLIRAGYTSVASLIGYPSTFPTDQYKTKLHIHQRLLVQDGVSIDDIYFKNMKFNNGGLIEADSDHLGIWADLQPL